jgi:hypothetical protein
MDTIVVLTKQVVDTVDLKVIDLKDVKDHADAIEKCNVILPQLEGKVAIWLDPEPLFIGVALMITTWLSYQVRSANWIIMQREVGWPLNDFQVAGSDYLKGENTQVSSPLKAEINISC